MARLVLALLLTGCAVGHAQSSAAPTRCRVDADCVIATSMPSCGPCGTCPGQPIALSTQWLAQQDRACAAQRHREEQRAQRAHARGEPSPVPPNCAPCAAPPESASHAWDAVCHERVCEAHERDAGPPARALRTLDDLLESPTS